MISAGAPLPPETARRFRERFGVPVQTFYGSSESGGITFDRRGDAAERGTVGTPIDGVEIDLDGGLRVRSPAVAAYRDVTPEFCAPCPHKSSCLGGCGAAAAATLGDPRGLDPFVAQHVDARFGKRLELARGT